MGLYEDLQTIVGKEDGPFEANDEVNKAMIRHWCEAMEDGNPVYTDEELLHNSLMSKASIFRNMMRVAFEDPKIDTIELYDLGKKTIDNPKVKGILLAAQRFMNTCPILRMLICFLLFRFTQNRSEKHEPTHLR